MADVSSPTFWDELYHRARQPWDLGGPTPALIELIESTTLPSGRIAVPGCGRGHDVRYLATRGHDAIGFDFVERAVTAARTLARIEQSAARFESRDVFGLGAEYPAAFDAAWEYTCYCAIDPARRAEYVEVLATILRPGGALLACFFPTSGGTGGPPFTVDVGEMRRLLSRQFTIEREFVPANSPPERRGQELAVYAIRTPC